MSRAGVINRKKKKKKKALLSHSYIKEKHNFCHKCLINNVGACASPRIVGANAVDNRCQSKQIMLET